jgi:ABC-type nitrate/sulfonate/bicarbonate transport system ATPase subunit
MAGDPEDRHRAAAHDLARRRAPRRARCELLHRGRYVTKTYRAGHAPGRLAEISLDIRQSEFVSLLGSSGRGKGTLLSDRVIGVSARLGRVKNDIRTAIWRQRSPSMKRDPWFVEYAQGIWQRIEDEVMAAIAPEQRG